MADEPEKENTAAPSNIPPHLQAKADATGSNIRQMNSNIPDNTKPVNDQFKQTDANRDAANKINELHNSGMDPSKVQDLATKDNFNK